MPEAEKKVGAGNSDAAKGGVPIIFFVIFGVLVLGGLASGGLILYRKRQRTNTGFAFDTVEDNYRGESYDGYDDEISDFSAYGNTGYPEEDDSDNIFPWEGDENA